MEELLHLKLIYHGNQWLDILGILLRQLLVLVVINGDFFLVSGLFLLVSYIKPDSMGGGDIKLMAAAGFALGWKNVLLALLVSGFTGTLYLIFSNTLKKENMKNIDMKKRD